MPTDRTHLSPTQPKTRRRNPWLLWEMDTDYKFNPMKYSLRVVISFSELSQICFWRKERYLLWRVQKVFHCWSISRHTNHYPDKSRTNQGGPLGNHVKPHSVTNPRLCWEWGALRQCVLDRTTEDGWNEKPEKLVNGVGNKTPAKYMNLSHSGQLRWGKVYIIWLHFQVK